MATYEVDPRDLAQRFREIEAQRPEAIARGVLSAALLGAEVVAKAAPKDQGFLKKSVRAEQTGQSAHIVVDAPHAGIVEMGSRPHRPPWKPIEEWVRRNLLGGFLVSHGASGRMLKRPRHLNAEEKAIAEVGHIVAAIVNKIAREGTKPTYFVRRSLSKLRQILKAEVERELSRGG